MYVCFTTIAHASLIPVSQPAAHARRLSAFHTPWTPPLLLAGFSAASRRAIKVLSTLQGAYDRLRGLVQCPKAYNSKTPPRLCIPACSSRAAALGLVEPWTLAPPLLLVGFLTAPRRVIKVLNLLRGAYIIVPGIL